MKILWTGSDVLYATKFVKHSKKSKYIYMFCFRVFAKLADIFCEQHYVVSKHLISELKPLKLKKKISVLVDPPLHPKKYKKIPHEGFNVLYYRGLGDNQKFKDWVYGKDIVDKIRGASFPGYCECSLSSLRTYTPLLYFKINVIEVNGKSDMSKIYPIIDFMVRPNRHDGNPRMVMECEINDIPYYWSKENPDINEITKQINEASKKDSKV